MAAIGMRFCSECNNMLYPREDREKRKLQFGCRNCGNTEPSEDHCIYTNELIKDNKMELEAIPNDIIDDPTLQRDIEVICPKCDKQGSVYFRSHDGAKQSTLGLIFICANYDCHHRWLKE